ncbi:MULTISPECIES: glycosyltransferase family A protein [unclassified Sedimentibacter]|uniref:glycosyltransferase family A protein n=1 Tax=unclassified Sedimentibacter TaxID=2649220 RepID=UPI0027E0D0FF|nr:glycosyltransferase family A protein [Sedimentibacter sp. MB35-C1]WMJ78084.1 glycosyltransferase family A protein [Sedimentibacter sp. MB35-C1]
MKVNNNFFTIVIATYNRPKSLEKLLYSLSDADFDNCSANLIISIDGNENKEVQNISNQFNWKYGEKHVVIHENQLGLKSHFLWCGDLTLKHGTVLFLEEDMLVVKTFPNFVLSFVDRFKNDDRIAGASLYSIEYNELTSTNFKPINDGYDNFFYQQPYWGKIYLRDKWLEFRKWFDKGEFDYKLLPSNVNKWKETSFKKHYILYLITKDKYYLFPRISLATNQGVSGIHASDRIEYQTELLYGDKEWTFSDLSISLSIYDAFQEIKPEVLKKYNESLQTYDFIVDINSTKKNFDKDYILTTRKSQNSILSFSLNLKPYEANILKNNNGEGINLIRTSEVRTSKYSGLISRIRILYWSYIRYNIFNLKKIFVLLAVYIFKKGKY